jgi:hypothetical protein
MPRQRRIPARPVLHRRAGAAADGGRSNTGIAIQAPVMRLSRDKAQQFLPGAAARGECHRRDRRRRHAGVEDRGMTDAPQTRDAA